jgi:hypothetical protein
MKKIIIASVIGILIQQIAYPKGRFMYQIWGKPQQAVRQ